MRRALLVIVAGAATALLIGWVLVVRLPDWVVARSNPEVPTNPAAETAVRKIRARLFYVSADGLRLQAVERDVPFAESPAEQASAVVREQLLAPPPPWLSALPAGTTLRALFLTADGDAYVDLSSEVTRGHTGGSLDELLAVYAIVNALTVNLPAVKRVQILVEGREVDSLAGHIDLRTPLPRSDRWSSLPVAPSEATPATAERPAAVNAQPP